MKKHFNIKNITVFVAIIMCFFAFKTNVKAEKEATIETICYYSLSDQLKNKFNTTNGAGAPEAYANDSNFTPEKVVSWWSDYNIFIKFRYRRDLSERTFITHGFYNTKTKTYYSNGDENNSAPTEAAEFRKHGMILLDSYVNFRDWEDPDYTVCPTLTYSYAQETSGYFYYAFTIFPFDIMNGKFKTQSFKNAKEACIGNKSNINDNLAGCGTFKKTSGPAGKGNNDNKGGGETNTTVTSPGECRYKYISTSTANQNYFTMTWDNAGIYFTGYVDSGDSFLGESEGKYSIDTAMSPYELGDKCPNTLYGSSNSSSITVAKDTFGGSYDVKFGLVISIDPNGEENIADMDETIKNGKTLKFVKQLYLFIRFLIPTLIIILSTLDFAGVVVSGESDKMEKAKKRFVLRLVVGGAFLFLPFILELILRVAGIIKSDQNLADIVYNIID